MTFKIIMNHFLVTINPFHYGDIAMKKCPVCGVEHSDIVPVCSICGSPLSGSEVTADVKAPVSEPVKAEPAVETPAPQPVADFSEEDILAAVSSVVSSSIQSEEPAEDDADDIDSPFVVNAMKTSSPAAQEVASPTKANAPRKGFYSKKVTPTKAAPVAAKAEPPKKEEDTAQSAEADVMDTTAIAAASALKVQEAMKNAEAARARQAAEAEAAAAEAPEQEPAAEHNWTERKHKRNQKSTTTPVIAAVCALLALLIVAMLFLLGKMMLDDGSSNKPADDAQQPGVEDEAQTGDQEGDTANDPVADPDAAIDGEGEDTDITPEEDVLPDAEGDEQQPVEGDGADAPAAEGDVQQPAEGQDEPADEPAVVQPELPAITEVNDTVYTTAAVNVRDYPSTDEGAIINTLAVGQAVTRTGKTANGWSQVEVGGKVGYISDTYLSTTKDSAGQSDDNDSASASTAYITSNGVNLRSEPSGTVLATLIQDQKVELTGKTSGNWTQVKVSGLTGYVYSTYLSSTKGAGADTSDDDTSTSRDDSDVKVTKVNETVYATTGVNVRDYPSSSDSSVITVLSKGQSVKRTGKTANGWSRIEVGGITGYVYSDYLSTSKNSSNNNDDDDSTGSTISGYILPKSNSKTYTASELSGLSKSDLRLARNEIFARHGRKFNDESLQNYFNSCSWYKGTIEPATFDANMTSYLNSYELANLDLIKSLE